MQATVVITTKNRKEELRTAVSSALRQSVPVEVLVIDDGSTDGTSEMIKSEFPQVRLERSEISLGLIAQRNRGAALASGEIIFSIDDDALFASREIVAQTLMAFDHPRIGAVAIPYIEPRKSADVRQRAPASGIYVANDFIGTAHALRKDVFIKAGGYRESLIHQGEEQDFCIRMLESGYVVRLGESDPIYHMESDRRDFKRMDYYGARNAIWFIHQNVPAPFVYLYLPITTWKVAIWSLAPSRLAIRLKAIASGYWQCFTGRVQRSPVSWRSFSLFRALKYKGATPLHEIEPELIALGETAAQGRNAAI